MFLINVKICGFFTNYFFCYIMNDYDNDLISNGVRDGICANEAKGNGSNRTRLK